MKTQMQLEKRAIKCFHGLCRYESEYNELSITTGHCCYYTQKVGLYKPCRKIQTITNQQILPYSRLPVLIALIYFIVLGADNSISYQFMYERKKKLIYLQAYLVSFGPRFCPLNIQNRICLSLTTNVILCNFLQLGLTN